MGINIELLHRIEREHRQLRAQSTGLLNELIEATRHATACRGALVQAQLRAAASAPERVRVTSGRTEGADALARQSDQRDADIANLRKIAATAPHQFEAMVSELSRSPSLATYTTAIVEAEARVAAADRVVDELTARQREVGAHVGPYAEGAAA